MGVIEVLMAIGEIMEILPHRYPFLLVDGVEELEKGKRIKAFKNVSINEPQFQGHFPTYPIMPGVLILEGMAQAAGLMLMEPSMQAIPLFILLRSGICGGAFFHHNCQSSRRSGRKDLRHRNVETRNQARRLTWGKNCQHWGCSSKEGCNK